MIRSKNPPRFQRNKAMDFLWALVALVLHVLPGAVRPAHAQGTRKDDIVFNSRGIPLAGATIRVCVMPATGQPCTPLAQLYSDPALTQAIANPTTTDGIGNYFFYAAPGKYEIEVSGPGITTKQLPNVILPSDPTSPTFSGAVSAFSLSLAGNLSVTGNTTVIGNLASGTLNLSNQSNPPGAAGAGTVNLYTKTTDKRLYYKDETGTEIGPLGPGTGAQTNVANTFTAPQNIDSDFHNKGPNPWFDISRYGGYASPVTTPPTIACATTSGSSTITCSGGTSDFAVGHGVAIGAAGPTSLALVPGAPVPVSSISVSSNVATILATGISFASGQIGTIAGSSDSAFNGSFTITNVGSASQWTFPVTHANCSPCAIGASATLAAPVSGQVTPQGILNGSTTYNYKVVAVDSNGGLSAASANFTTTTGAATLGVNSVSIAQYQRTSGLVTFTTSAAHNLQSGVEVNVAYSGSGARDTTVEGAFTIFSTPTGTTFTVLQTGVPNSVGAIPVSDTAQVVAKNLVQWPMQAYAAIKSYIYRCLASCGTNTNYVLVGVTQGMDGSFTDWGSAAGSLSGSVLPAYVPPNPPSVATNGYLQTTITNIAGNTVTLAANAGATVGSATVLHDNAANVVLACANMNGQGGTVYFPSSNPQGSLYNFNSPLKMTSCPANTRLLLGAQLFVNESILGRNTFQVEGLGQGARGNQPSFVVSVTATIQGFAFPLFLLTPGTGSSVTFTNLALSCSQPYQSCVVQDQDSTGNNVTNITYNNVYQSGNAGSQPFRMGGGFGFNWSYGSFAVGGGSGWGYPPIFLDTVQQGLGSSSQQLGGILYTDKTYIAGGEMLFDAAGVVPLAGGGGHFSFKELLNESSRYPSVRFNTGSNIVSGVVFEKPSYADPTGGAETPLIDLTNATSVSNFRVIDPGCNQGPLFEMGSQGGVEVYNGSEGCSSIGAGTFLYHSQAGAGMSEALVNMPLGLSGANGQAYVAMSTPAAPSVSISGAAGPSAGTYYYFVSAVDVNGNVTVVSPPSSSITVNGSQGVLVTWTLVPGQAFTTVCRGSTPNGPVCAVISAGFNVVGTSFTDNGGYFPSGSPPQGTTAGSSSMGPNGLQTSAMRIVGGGFASTLNTASTANRTQTLADANGFIPVTSYLNSGYDNFNRANGAIGTNWTTMQNTLSVASNVIQGGTAGANNSAYWSATAFPPDQFAQATITALNGTTDFSEVYVRASGTNNAYYAAEDTTTLFCGKLIAGTATNVSTTGVIAAVGDLLRVEVQGTTISCYRNGGAAALTFTDSALASGQPGINIAGNVATMDNWSGGALHPIGQLDVEADYTKVQHMNAGVGFGSETFTASPRAEQNVFLPGALTSTWTGATWTTDKAVTVTRIQVQAKTAPAGCATNAVVRFTDGTTPVNLTISAAANDSGAIAQNYAAGSALQVLVQTAAAGCTTSPADANVVVQYRMQ